MSENRQHVHELIDLLPPAQLAALEGLLESIVDPVRAALRDAPFDDEPESEEEKIAVSEARSSIEQCGTVSHRDAMRRLGLD